MDTRPRQDFKVERDEHGQRYAFPTSAAGEWYFSTHLGDFDLSELGWELDVNDDAMPKFEKAMADSQLVARECSRIRGSRVSGLRPGCGTG